MELIEVTKPPVLERPNIVMIMTDQQGCHMLGCYGNRAIRTPNIDRLAEQGILFRNHYVQSPLCMPSRASMFTGRYPSVCGTLINGVPLRYEEITLPYALAMGGYHTAAFGKLHFRNECISLDPSEGTKCEYEGIKPYYGFKECKISNGNFYGPYLRWIEKEFPQYYDDVIGKRKKLLVENTDCWIKEIPAEISQTYWVGKESIDFIHRDHKSPFFLLSSFLDPHHPFDPPESYAKMYDETELFPRNVGENDIEHYQYSEADWNTVRKMAYAMVTQIDDEVGKIVKALEDRGILDQTIILFTSDHGEYLGEHNLLYKGPYHYDELVKTPFIWCSPYRWKDSRAVDCLTQSMDIMPTLLELAGLPIPDPVQGSSMLPLLDGMTEEGREWVLVDHDQVNTLVTPEWKISVRIDGGTGMLFNRIKDPKEHHNLWHDSMHADVKGMMLQKMISCMMSVKEHPWRQEGYW